MIASVRTEAAPQSAAGPHLPVFVGNNMSKWLHREALITRQQSNGTVPGTAPRPGEQTAQTLDLTFLANPGAPDNANALKKNQLPPYTDWEPAYAPDRRTIAFSSNRPLAGNATSTGYHIFTMFNDGSFQQPLAGTVGTDQQWPSYSPDGARLTYSSRDTAGVAQIHVVGLQTGVDTQITTGAGNKIHPSWSHGDLIAFQSTETTLANPNALSKIWTVLYTGGTRYQVTGVAPQDAANAGSNDTEPAWEPSGLHVAFTRTVGNQERIWIISSIALTSDPANPLSVAAVNQFTDFQTPLNAGGVPSQDQNATWRPQGPNFVDPTSNPNNDILAFASTRKSSADPTQTGVGAISVGNTFGIYRVPITYTDAGQLTPRTETASVAANLATPAIVVAEDTGNTSFQAPGQTQPSGSFQFDDIQPSWSPATQTDNITGQALIANEIGYASDNAFPYLNGAAPTGTPVKPLTVFDIWRTRPFDITPPSLEALPSVTPRIQRAGSTVTISCLVSDLGVGIAHVYAQIKNPNSFLQDRSLPPVRSFQLTGSGENDLILDGHRIYEIGTLAGLFSITSTKPFDDLEGAYQEIGYQPINPQTYSYADTGAENLPFDITNGGSITTLADPNQVIPDTLELLPNPQPTDPSGDVTYSVTWTTDPAHPSDYYLDLIAIDKVGNTIDYDNVWGFTTQPFSAIGNQANRILLVNDYMSPQNFLFGRGSRLAGLSFGAESFFTDNPVGKKSALDPGFLPITAQQPTFTLDALGLLDQHNLDIAPPADTENPTLIGPVANTLGPGSSIDDFEHAQSVGPGPAGFGSWVVGPQTIIPPLTTAGFSFRSLVDVSTSDPSTNLDGYDIWRILCRGPVPPTTLAAYGPSSINQPSLTNVNLTSQKPVYKSCVIWGSPFTNDEYVGPGTILDVATQQMLANFVHPTNSKFGGHLFLTGQDIGFALSPTPASATFLSQTFGVQFASDAGGGGPLAAQGGPIGARFNPGLTPLVIGGGFTAVDDDQTFPDSMTVLANAVGDYSNGSASTTSATDFSKTFYMPNGFEGVNEEVANVGNTVVGALTYQLDSPRNTRSALMHGIVCWMRDYSISGVVNELQPDNTTRPAANALVSATVNGKDFSTLTDLQGNYTIDGLPSGGALLRTVHTRTNVAFPVFERPSEGSGGVAISSGLPGFQLAHSASGNVGHGGETVRAATLLLNRLEPGSVTGKVTDNVTGKPLAGVTVTLQNIPFTNVQFTTTTDINGNYTFTNVPATPPAGTTGAAASSYVLTFSLTGYNTETLSQTTGTTPTNLLVGSQTTIIVNAALIVQGGNISGTVTDGTNPVAGATVTATPKTLTTGPVTAITNSLGQFTFSNLYPDVYVLSASATGRAAGSPINETVTPAAIISGVVLTVGPPVTTPPPVVTGTDSISGTVSLAAGTTTQPISGATVQLLNTSTNKVVATTTTNSLGAYSFTSLLDGTYQVSVTSTTQSQATPTTVTVSKTVNNGAATGINFTLSPIFTFPQGVSMVSIPYTYSAGTGDAATLFGTQLIATYVPQTNNYLLYPNLPGTGGTQTQPGRGYWIKEAAPVLFLNPGILVSSPFQYVVSPGWNEIGDPFTTALDTSLIQVQAPFAVGATAANQPLRFQDALTAGIIRTPIFGYSQSTNAYFPTTTLAPFQGYWLYVDPTGSRGLPVTLTYVNPTVSTR